MKTLLYGFVVLCGVLAAGGVWMALKTVGHTSAPPDRGVPAAPMPAWAATRPATSPRADRSGEAGATVPPVASVAPVHGAARADRAASAAPSRSDGVAAARPGGASTTDVHWADEGGRRRAERRFATLRNILATDPHNEAALREALRIARKLNWPNEACDLLGRLVRQDPDDTTLRLALATELMRLERWIEALPHLEQLVRACPRDARAWYDLAIAHQAAGHLAAARRAWDRVIALKPSADAHARRGEVLLDLRRWSAAAADFEQALRLDRDSVDAALNLALVRARLGQYEQAQAVLAPLVRRHPRNILVLNRLARLAWERCQSDPGAAPAHASDTARWARRSLEIVPNQPEIRDLLRRSLAAKGVTP